MPTIRVRPRHPVTGSPMAGEQVNVAYLQVLFGADQSTIARTSYRHANAQGFVDFVLDAATETDPANAQVGFYWNGIAKPGLLATVPATEGPHVDGSIHYWELLEVLDPDQLDPLPTIVGVQSVTGTGVDNTDPRNPIVTGGGGSGDVVSIVEGTAITVDDTDPANPIVGVTPGSFDAAGAASAAQAAAIAAAAIDATTKAAAAQAASQPLDSDLTAIAALSTTAFGRSVLTQANAAALRTLAGLGTAATSNTGDFDAAGAAAAAQAASQPLDSDLTAIAALTTTSFGRSFLALADAAAARTLLGLGTLATQSGTFSGTSSGTNTGDQTITLTGDVTGSGTGSFAATLKNTGTAGTYGDATHVPQFTTDAQGRVTAVSSVAVTAGASNLTRTAVKTGNYTAVLFDLVPCDTSGGTFTVTLPAASGGKGRIAIKLVTAGNTLSLALTGSDHFNTSAGPTSGSLTLANQGILLESDGAGIWTTTADDIPLTVLDARYPLLSTVTTKGDILAATASATLARKAAGTDGFALTADSTQSTGLNYATRDNSHQIKTGGTLWHAHGSSVSNQNFTTTNTLRSTAIPIDRPCTITALRIFTNSTVASSTVRLGIYSDDGGGRPGSLLIDGGTVDTSSGTGAKDLTISQAITVPGLYHFVAVQQGGASGVTFNAGMGAGSSGAHDLLLSLDSSNATNALQFGTYDGYTHSGSVSGALPGTFTVSGVNDGRCPKFAFKVT